MSTFNSIHVEEIYLRGELLDLGTTTVDGTPGERGVKGDDGPQGQQGGRGLQGLRGIAGADGAAGEKGEKGEAGEVTVDDGQTVVTGPPGPSGPAGTQGVEGNVGTTGTNGEKGQTGDTRGDRGEIGPQGIQGVTGQTGIQGAIGPAGAVVVEDGGATTTITGPPGADGKDSVFNLKRIFVNAFQEQIGDFPRIDILPEVENVVEAGLYYYKTEATGFDVTLHLPSDEEGALGRQVGKFHGDRKQHMIFLKAGNSWAY